MRNTCVHMNLDELDIAILTHLQADGRVTTTDLGQLVGLSPSACLRRVRALEESGVIDRYVAILDPGHVGRSNTVFVEISLSGQSNDSLDAFEKAIKECPDVMTCHLMAGMADYLVQIMCHDTADYERIHRDYLTHLPNVASLRSNFALREVQNTTAHDLL